MIIEELLKRIEEDVIGRDGQLSSIPNERAQEANEIIQIENHLRSYQRKELKRIKKEINKK